MNSSDAAGALRDLHASCDCEILTTGNPSELRKDGCTLWVENLTIALDCDDCAVFLKGSKPDVIALRRCDEDDEWLVFEMKQRSRAKAGRQIQSGLRKLLHDARFQVRIRAVRAFLVVNGRRSSDVQVFRQIGRLRFGSQYLTPVLLSSGHVLRCPPDPVAEAAAS